MAAPVPNPWLGVPSWIHEPPERVHFGDELLPDTHAEDARDREHARLVEARPPAGVDGSVFPC